MSSEPSEPLTGGVREDTVSTRMSWQAFGGRIRELRDKRGLTREALAEKTGVSAVYIKKLEAGERTSPSLPALASIARALGATLRIELVERAATRKRRG
jgi:transcriptional regulator with XRE-family HTH domain